MGFADLFPRKDLLFPLLSLPAASSPAALRPPRAGLGPAASPPSSAGQKPEVVALPCEAKPLPEVAPSLRSSLLLPRPEQLSSSPLSSASHLAFPHPRPASSSPAAPHLDACLCRSALPREPLRSEAGRPRRSPLPSALLNHGCLPAPRKPHAP